MIAVKLCVDCKWCVPEVGIPLRHASCGHPSSFDKPRISPVTGEPGEPIPAQCSSHRLSHISDDPCGPEGKYWEAAEPRGFA